jgi:hypothetical protein
VNWLDPGLEFVVDSDNIKAGVVEKEDDKVPDDPEVVGMKLDVNGDEEIPDNSEVTTLELAEEADIIRGIVAKEVLDDSVVAVLELPVEAEDRELSERPEVTELELDVEGPVERDPEDSDITGTELVEEPERVKGIVVVPNVEELTDEDPKATELEPVGELERVNGAVVVPDPDTEEVEPSEVSLAVAEVEAEPEGVEVSELDEPGGE